MDPIYNFLNKIAYKFDKGYPELTSPKDRLIIESMLSELGISIDLLEATTSATEDLHEIFTAMFVAGHQPVEDFANADWEKEVNNTPRLKNKQQHIDIISKYIGPNLPLKDKYSKLYDDAKKIADQLEINLDFSDAGAERVFATGPKEKADIIIYQPGRRESGLGVSLKYGEGQFNSLSPNTVLKNLFDLKDLQAPTISPETGKLSKVPGILTQVTKDDDKALEKLNMGAKAYINLILDNFEDITMPKTGKGGNTKAYLDGNTKVPEFKYDDMLKAIKETGKIPVKFSEKQGGEEIKFGGITLPEKVKLMPIEDITWKLYSKTPNVIKKTFSKAYNANPIPTLAKQKGGAIEKKSEAINNIIKDYIENETDIELNTKIDGASDEGKQLRKFLAIILGSTDQSYYYIGQGGKKATFIPSLGRLEDLEYYIQPKYREDLNDFVIELTIYGKAPEGEWTELFGTDVKLRFANYGGQWDGDITQKGSKFTIGKNGEEVNMNKLFGFK